MIELHSRGRELVKGSCLLCLLRVSPGLTIQTAFKFDREVAPAERYQYLQTLWRNFVQMADFSRDESIYWRSLRIPGPGEVFSLSSEEIIPEIVYDDLVHTEKLVPEYSTPHFEGSMDTTSSPPPLVEQGLVVHSMPVDGCYTAKTPWRRYVGHCYPDHCHRLDTGRLCPGISCMALAMTGLWRPLPVSERAQTAEDGS